MGCQFTEKTRNLIFISIITLTLIKTALCLESCEHRDISFKEQKQYISHCIASCLELSWKDASSKKCTYNSNNGSIVPKSKCPEPDCSSPPALALKPGMAALYFNTRINKQKKLCGKRFYFSLFEMAIVRGTLLCPCFVENVQLYTPESDEQIKCLLENISDSAKQKGAILTSGFRGVKGNLGWCGGGVRSNISNALSSRVRPAASSSMNETCLVLSFTPFKKGEKVPDDFVFKEVSCSEGMFHVVCESPEYV